TVPALPDDIPTISKAVHHTGATLLVIDPLTAHLGGDVNSHRDSDIRRALAPLAKMASELHVAVLVIRHLNKQSGGSPMYRGGGSIGIIGAARLGMLLGRSPDEDGTLVLAPTKSNLSRLPASLSLEIVSSPGDDTVGVVRWLGPSPHSAYDVLNVKPPKESPQLEAAKEWLLDELADGEPQKASIMWKQAEALGHAERTVRRALRELHVSVERIGGIAGSGAWFWTLTKAANGAKAATSEEETT